MGHGNLYVKFDVEFPTKGELQSDQMEGLKTILNGPKHDLTHNSNVEYLEDFHENDTNPNPEGGRTKEDEEEDSRGGQRVQCAQN